MKRFATTGAVTILLWAGLAAAQQSTEPIHFSKLLPLLPDKVDGFVADVPEGSTASADTFKVTEVARTYHKGNDGGAQTATVRISQGSTTQSFAELQSALKQSAVEGEDGYEKDTTVDGYPAVEKYTAETKSGELTVLVANRYLVQIEVNGLESASLHDWWKRLDAKKLAEMRS